MENISPRAGVVNKNLGFGRSFFACLPAPDAPISPSRKVGKPLPTNRLHHTYRLYRDQLCVVSAQTPAGKKKAEAQDAKSERGAGNSNLGQHPTSASNS
jgi:hypothetical protein